MKRAAIGLLALLIAVTAIAATQYGRVQLTASATIDHLTKDKQFVAHDFAPEADVCGSGSDRVLCWDAATFDYMLTLGTWSNNDVKVFSGAFGIVNVELGDNTIDRIVCADVVGTLCSFLVINLHTNANLYCATPPGGPWQLTGAETGVCDEFWNGPGGGENATGNWVLEASDGLTTGYLPALTYGDPGGVVYTGVDSALGHWNSAGGNQPATEAVDTHAWVEVAFDFTGLGSDPGATWSCTLYVVFSTPGP